MDAKSTEVEIPVGGKRLAGTLTPLDHADGIIVFAHGSGSSRHSSRNRHVATVLHASGFATLLFDLLTLEEDNDYANRFDIPLITERLVKVTEWVKTVPSLAGFEAGYFGASTGAAAALAAAATPDNTVKAVVSRGGRPDLAAAVLPNVHAPTLLMVGSLDDGVIQLNKKAFDLLSGKKELRIVEGATHLFEEPGKLEEVSTHAAAWFSKYVSKVPV